MKNQNREKTRVILVGYQNWSKYGEEIMIARDNTTERKK